MRAYTDWEKKLMVRARLEEAKAIFKEIELGTRTHKPFTAIMLHHGVKPEDIAEPISEAQQKAGEAKAEVQDKFRKLAKRKAQLRVVD